MMKSHFNKTVLGAVFFLTFVFLGLEHVYALDKIIAIVNNDAVTQKDLDDFFNFMRVQLQSEMSAADAEIKLTEMKPDLLQRLVEDRLILQEAKLSEYRAEPGRVKSRIEEIKKQYATETDFQNALSRDGLVQADIENKIRDQFLMYAVIEQKVKSKVSVSPVEVTDYFAKNQKQFSLPEERIFAAVNTPSSDSARKLVSQVRLGKDFQASADVLGLSVNRASAFAGGELKRDIEDAIFKLSMNEVSEALQIEKVYYVFMLESINPARAQSLTEAREKIHAYLLNLKTKQALSSWLAELKKKSYIKLFE